MQVRARELFTTVRSEGALLPPELLQRVADGDRDLPGTRPADYHLVEGESFGEAINRSWSRLQGAWLGFRTALEALAEGDAGTSVTRERWLLVLLSELGYGRLPTASAVEIEGRSYPVSHAWADVPIHLVGARIDLDSRTAGVAGAARQSPHSLVQELLNASDTRLWGIVSNGRRLRLLRDNAQLTRQAFVEFDLETMMDAEVYSDFALLWLVCHQSRVEAERPEECWLERWSGEAAERGTRARESLRQGVEAAISALGAGFLAHPANNTLRTDLRTGTLDTQDYYRQLLRLVYRLLFLFVAEDRDLLAPPQADEAARERYLASYGTQRLRELAERRVGGRHPDLWRGLRLVMDCLGSDEGEPGLALPALGSFLWSKEAVPDLGDADLANRDLLDAVRELAFVEQDRTLRAVDYRNLGAEELGSIYESLLELRPELDIGASTFALSSAVGSERKTTGSYYTPTSLIVELLDSALDPLLDRAAASDDPEAAILALKVCDPACGSGHFLIAAAQRIAKRLAAIRTGDAEPAPAPVRHALRDVISRCIYGVDVNEMAVELCKVSLWMEGLDPGRPLSFLDAQIKCGNSLLGATPELLAGGVPDEAFTPLAGDDRAFASELKRRNRRERAGQLSLGDEVQRFTQALARSATTVALSTDDSTAALRKKELGFRRFEASDEYRRARLAVDAWCATFVAPKRREMPQLTEASVRRAASDALTPDEAAAVARLRAEYGFFQWHIEFPHVFRQKGFDCVLGNPPWERTAFEDKPFFSLHAPEVLDAPTTQERKARIALLRSDRPDVYERYAFEKRASDAANLLASFRFPLGSSGRTNTYGLFAELFTTLMSLRGRAGVILPTGVATDAPMEAFWRMLVDKGLIQSLFDFENRKGIFPAVHRSTRFCLLALATAPFGGAATSVRCGFLLTAADDIRTGHRVYEVPIALLAVINPNTKQAPVCLSQRDLDLVARMHRTHPILALRGGKARARATRVMASTDKLLQPQRLEALVREGGEVDLTDNAIVSGRRPYRPLLEAKQINQFDPCFATYDGVGADALKRGDPRPVRDDERPTTSVPLPRLWSPETTVNQVLDARGLSDDWLLCVRDVTNATNERTAILAVVPRLGLLQPLNGVVVNDASEALWILAALNSFAGDYIARQKTPGTHLNVTIFNQLPVPEMEGEFVAFVLAAAFELSYVISALKGFALALGREHAPYSWSPPRRQALRTELDAALFHVYGFGRDDAAHVLDSFPIVCRKDEAAHGEYRTKTAILGAYDTMEALVSAGHPYESRLEPPPGYDPFRRAEATAPARPATKPGSASSY